MLNIHCSILYRKLHRIHFSVGVRERRVLLLYNLNVASVIFVSETVEERGDKSARLQQNERGKRKKKGIGLT